MLLMPEPASGDARSVHRGADALARLRDRRPGDARAYAKDPRADRPPRRGVPARDRHRRHRPTSVPSASSSSSTRSRTSSARTASHYAVDSAEGHWNSGKPGLGYTVARRRRATSRRRRTTRCTTCAREMVLTLERLGIPCEFHHHEVASGGQCEIDLRYQTADADGRPDHGLQVRRQEHRPRGAARRRRSCRSRSSATTARACTRTSPSGRRARR